MGTVKVLIFLTKFYLKMLVILRPKVAFKVL